MAPDLIAAVFGWMTVINLVVYMVAAAFITFGRGSLIRLQKRLTGVSADRCPELCVDYPGRYRIATACLALTIVD